jgi:hypothetical protein
MAAHHLTDAQRTLIPQMIERAPLTPVEVMEAARNPARIAEAMLTKHTDPAHQIPANADAFRRTVIPVLTRLLADTAISDTLRPAFENAVAESLRFIGEQVERMASQLHDTAYRLGVQDTLVLELARRYAPGSEGDFTAAIRGLEQALQTAAQMHHTARLPQNTSDQVDAVLAEVDRLNREGQLEAGAQALETALLNQDADAARVISHKLVGIYAQVGCEKLSRSALAVEMTSDDILCLSVGRNFIAQPRPCLAGIETLKLLHGAG